MNFNGGPTPEDAAQLLLRQAVAALLNASLDIGYPLTEAEVIEQVNAALATEDRDQMLALAGQLDQYNNLESPFCGGANGHLNGDKDCDGTVTPADALKALRGAAGLSGIQCGEDDDCNSRADVFDVLRILRQVTHRSPEVVNACV